MSILKILGGRKMVASKKRQVLVFATAGMLESCDALISVEPVEPGAGITIELISSVKKQYGKHIECLTKEFILEQGFEDIKVKIEDKGAWDYTLRARLRTALERSEIDASCQ